MGASPSAPFFFSCRQCNMIHFFSIVTVGIHTDSNSGVAAFTFFFLASGNFFVCSVFTLWPRGKLSDCSTKGGQLHRRRRNLKDPRPRCKKPRVAEKKWAGVARNRSPRSPDVRRGATEGSGGTREGAGAPPEGSKRGGGPARLAREPPRAVRRGVKAAAE